VRGLTSKTRFKSSLNGSEMGRTDVKKLQSLRKLEKQTSVRTALYLWKQCYISAIKNNKNKIYHGFRPVAMLTKITPSDQTSFAGESYPMANLSSLMISVTM
jgi:hypothetical protein